MLDRLEELARLLRKNGVAVSTPEIMDAARALGAVGVGDRAIVQSALATTLVKRASDLPTFRELFESYFFRGAGEELGQVESTLDALLGQVGVDPAVREQVASSMADDVADLGALGRAALGMPVPDLPNAVRAAGERAQIDQILSPLQVGVFSHRLGAQLGLNAAAPEFGRALRRLVAAGLLDEDQRAAILQAIEENLDSIRRRLRNLVREELRRQHLDYYGEMTKRALAQKPLSQLTEAEVGQLRAEVARLARILRARVQLAPRAHRRGRLDLRRTLRRSLATGGVPFEIRRRERKRRKPRLVVLCDVSDSVRNVARFMLYLVYMLQELFDRVQSFAFVAELEEVTELFRQHDIDRAVEMIYRGEAVNVFANSNYGLALRQFCDRHLTTLTSRSTVLIIGDARNNYNPTEHRLLGDLRRRAKQIIWINPETRPAWEMGDSAMRDYQPYCDRVVVAYNLESLRKVIDDLVM